MNRRTSVAPAKSIRESSRTSPPAAFPRTSLRVTTLPSAASPPAASVTCRPMLGTSTVVCVGSRDTR